MSPYNWLLFVKMLHENLLKSPNLVTLVTTTILGILSLEIRVLKVNAEKIFDKKVDVSN